MSETKKGFNLADVLSDVSNLDTFPVENREQIEYISIDLIVSDDANFYELSEIDALAANIELIGLQQPLRVRQHPDDESQVIIVSGHRRCAAIRKLVDEGREDLRDVPCIMDKSTGSAALQELRLIYANSDTRRMTSADINKQAERIERLLYQLKEEGYEFPGRMRDHVAECCKVSKTKLARLKMIREKLHENWQPAYQENKINESVAYALAQLPVEDQLTIWSVVTETRKDFRNIYECLIERSAKRFKQIAEFAEKAPCHRGCQNLGNKRMKAVIVDYYSTFNCDKCCGKCPDLAKCKYSCPGCATKKGQLKADAKAQKQQEKAAEEERQRPLIQQVENLWTRFGTARRDAQKSVKDVFVALGRHYSPYDDKLYGERELCLDPMTPSTDLPYGYDVSLRHINSLIKVADCLNVSLDYLLCRTANPIMNDAAPAPAAVAPEDLLPATWYPASVEPPIGKDIIVIANDGFAEDTHYTGSGLGSHAVTAWQDVRFWALKPTETSDNLPAVEASGMPKWMPGSTNPPEATDAVAEFIAEDLTLRKLAHWDGFHWKFAKSGSTIDAACARWYPIPEEGGEKDA